MTSQKTSVSENKPFATVVVPAYREEHGLPIVLSKLFKVLNKGYEVIVIDDGSDDGTSAAAQKFPVRLIRHEVNKGKAEAIITAWRNARTDRLIFIDADDTYPVEPIPEMARALGEYGMVIGSRRRGRENIPLMNRMGNWFIRTCIRTIYGFKPYDPLTGLWGIKKQHLGKYLPSMRRAPEAEIAIKAARSKLKMLDLSIVYYPRVGKTKLNPFKAGFENLRLIVTLLWWKPAKND
jgi:glycosyltransferase involved in cell wall biosynthesis